MFCPNCGAQIPDDSSFCEKCGSRIEKVIERKEKPVRKPGSKRTEPVPERKVSENIRLCPDGKYRWVYEVEMLKNPTILITVLKVMLLSFGIVLAFLGVISLIGGDYRYWDADDVLSFFKVFLILLLVMLAISVIAYLIVAAMHGWTYQVLYTMDEKGVELKEMRKDFGKAEALGWLAAAVGEAVGNMSMMGAGVLAATRDSSMSVFRDVRKVKAVRRRHVIYVNQVLEHNQVYAEDADFDFVLNYICEHVPKTAKIIR